jgi:hypothetical protein
MTKEERKAALLQGAALVMKEGLPVTRAADLVGVAETTLRVHIQRLSADPAAVKEAADSLAAAHVTIATAAADRVFSRLDSLPDDLLIRAYGIASDKVAVHQGWGRDRDHATTANAADALAKLADAIAGGGTLSVTVTPPDPAASAIDVTPSDDPD